MKAFQEITDWATEFDMPNHVYFLSDSKEKMYGYVQTSTGLVQTMSKPYKFKAGGRKFKEVENRWNFVVKEEVVESCGKEYRVPGSKGSIYTVTDDAGVWSCTCSGFKFRNRCRHIEEISTTVNSCGS
jgi:hypothetical protein